MKFNLKNKEIANKLIVFNRKYPGLTIDITYNHYTVDGHSYLGVASLIGHEVNINVIAGKEETIEEFYKGVESFEINN